MSEFSFYFHLKCFETPTNHRPLQHEHVNEHEYVRVDEHVDEHEYVDVKKRHFRYVMVEGFERNNRKQVMNLVMVMGGTNAHDSVGI